MALPEIKTVGPPWLPRPSSSEDQALAHIIDIQRETNFVETVLSNYISKSTDSDVKELATKMLEVVKTSFEDLVRVAYAKYKVSAEADRLGLVAEEDSDSDSDSDSNDGDEADNDAHDGTSPSFLDDAIDENAGVRFKRNIHRFLGKLYGSLYGYGGIANSASMVNTAWPGGPKFNATSWFRGLDHSVVYRLEQYRILITGGDNYGTEPNIDIAPPPSSYSAGAKLVEARRGQVIDAIKHVDLVRVYRLIIDESTPVDINAYIQASIDIGDARAFACVYLALQRRRNRTEGLKRIEMAAFEVSIMKLPEAIRAVYVEIVKLLYSQLSIGELELPVITADFMRGTETDEQEKLYGAGKGYIPTAWKVPTTAATPATLTTTTSSTSTSSVKPTMDIDMPTPTPLLTTTSTDASVGKPALAMLPSSTSTTTPHRQIKTFGPPWRLHVAPGTDPNVQPIVDVQERTDLIKSMLRNYNVKTTDKDVADLSEEILTIVTALFAELIELAYTKYEAHGVGQPGPAYDPDDDPDIDYDELVSDTDDTNDGSAPYFLEHAIDDENGKPFKSNIYRFVGKLRDTLYDSPDLTKSVTSIGPDLPGGPQKWFKRLDDAVVAAIKRYTKKAGVVNNYGTEPNIDIYIKESEPAERVNPIEARRGQVLDAIKYHDLAKAYLLIIDESTPYDVPTYVHAGIDIGDARAFACVWLALKRRRSRDTERSYTALELDPFETRILGLQGNVRASYIEVAKMLAWPYVGGPPELPVITADFVHGTETLEQEKLYATGKGYNPKGTTAAMQATLPTTTSSTSTSSATSTMDIDMPALAALPTTAATSTSTVAATTPAWRTPTPTPTPTTTTTATMTTTATARPSSSASTASRIKHEQQAASKYAQAPIIASINTAIVTQDPRALYNATRGEYTTPDTMRNTLRAVVKIGNDLLVEAVLLGDTDSKARKRQTFAKEFINELKPSATHEIRVLFRLYLSPHKVEYPHRAGITGKHPHRHTPSTKVRTPAATAKPVATTTGGSQSSTAPVPKPSVTATTTITTTVAPKPPTTAAVAVATTTMATTTAATTTTTTAPAVPVTTFAMLPSDIMSVIIANQPLAKLGGLALADRQTFVDVIQRYDFADYLGLDKMATQMKQITHTQLLETVTGYRNRLSIVEKVINTVVRLMTSQSTVGEWRQKLAMAIRWASGHVAAVGNQHMLQEAIRAGNTQLAAWLLELPPHAGIDVNNPILVSQFGSLVKTDASVNALLLVMRDPRFDLGKRLYTGRTLLSALQNSATLVAELIKHPTYDRSASDDRLARRIATGLTDVFAEGNTVYTPHPEITQLLNSRPLHADWQLVDAASSLEGYVTGALRRLPMSLITPPVASVFFAVSGGSLPVGVIDLNSCVIRDILPNVQAAVMSFHPELLVELRPYTKWRIIARSQVISSTDLVALKYDPLPHIGFFFAPQFDYPSGVSQFDKALIAYHKWHTVPTAMSTDVKPTVHHDEHAMCPKCGAAVVAGDDGTYPCKDCGQVVYCSKKCREAHASTHKLACPIHREVSDSTKAPAHADSGSDGSDGSESSGSGSDE
jgi:predicted RNA-binding Zn-ribbon protein involved in translation (DUF1610 family)